MVALSHIHCGNFIISTEIISTIAPEDNQLSFFVTRYLIKKYKSWTMQSVLDEIRRLAKAGEPLFSQHAQDHNKPLYMAAIKRFGN